MKRFLALLALPLAACASTGDYPGATPAAAPLTPPVASSAATVNEPIAQVDTFAVIPAPPVLTPTRSYNTDGTYYELPRMQQPGVLPPLRRYNTDGTYTPEPMPGVLPPLRAY